MTRFDKIGLHALAVGDWHGTSAAWDGVARPSGRRAPRSGRRRWAGWGSARRFCRTSMAVGGEACPTRRCREFSSAWSSLPASRSGRRGDPRRSSGFSPPPILRGGARSRPARGLYFGPGPVVGAGGVVRIDQRRDRQRRHSCAASRSPAPASARAATWARTVAIGGLAGILLEGIDIGTAAVVSRVAGRGRGVDRLGTRAGTAIPLIAR